MALTEEQILRAKQDFLQELRDQLTVHFPRITYEMRPNAKPETKGYVLSHSSTIEELDYTANRMGQTGKPAIHLKYEP